MNDADMFWFYAQDGADPSLFGAITPDEATVVTGIDYYFGIGPEGYDVDKAVSCFQSAAAAGVPDAYYWLGRYYRNSTLCIDHFQLSKSQQVRRDTDTLREQTQRLLMDYRLDYAENKLRELKRAISLSADNPQQLMMLVEQYKEMQNIRNTLAKKLGNNIIV